MRSNTCFPLRKRTYSITTSRSNRKFSPSVVWGSSRTPQFPRPKRRSWNFACSSIPNNGGPYSQIFDIVLDCSGLAFRCGMAAGGGYAAGEEQMLQNNARETEMSWTSGSTQAAGADSPSRPACGALREWTGSMSERVEMARTLRGFQRFEADLAPPSPARRSRAISALATAT